MHKQPIAKIRDTLQFLQRMYNRLYATTTKWRIIAHVANLADKILTFAGITMYHLQEINPIGKLFLGDTISHFGIIAFFLYGVLAIEYISRVKPKIMPFSVSLLTIAIGTNTYLLLRGVA